MAVSVTKDDNLSFKPDLNWEKLLVEKQIAQITTPKSHVMTCPYLIASIRCPSPKMTPLNRERRRLCYIFKTAE